MRTGILFILSLAGFYSGAKTMDEAGRNTEISYRVKKITGINTAATEFCPVVVGNELVFVSDRERDPMTFGENRWKKKKQLNLFKAGYNQVSADSVLFSKAEIYRDGLTSHYHEGPICFDPSGNYAIVTRVVAEQRTNKPQLYAMRKEKGKWSKPVRLPFCKKDFSYGHACFSDDGKVLYFSSDQPGTLGGKDLFSCSFDQGNFGVPVNLGGKVNSIQNELFPFFRSGTLYFSSDRTGSLGGMDIYSVAYEHNRFGDPVNAGSSINTSTDEYAFYLSPSGHDGFFASNRTGNNDDLYFFTVVDPNAPVEVSGKFAYARLQDNYPGGLSLQLLNESGGVVQETRTDEKGTFRFSGLPPRHDYSLNVLQPEEGLVLRVVNTDGKESVLMSDGLGLFVYKKLESETGTLDLMQLDEAGINRNKGYINGRFVHERLNGTSLEGMKVMLVDEAGNVYARTVTDKKGNFSFARLPGSQDFHIATEDHSDDLLLLVYNEKDEVVAEMKRQGFGPFVFRRMAVEQENILAMLNNPDLDFFPAPTKNLEGKFRFSDLDSETDSLNFMVTDEAGNLLKRGTTDEKGNFSLAGLPPGEVYIFKLENGEAGLGKKGFQLQMLSRYGETLQTIDPDEAGLYVFDGKQKTASVPGTLETDPLANKMNQLPGDEEEKPMLMNETEAGLVVKPEILVVYFDNDKSELSPEAQADLQPYLEQLKADPSLVLQLDGHADAIDNDAYNLQLSMRRMLHTKQYFVQRGIPSNRIKGYYHGESQLVNPCADPAKCSDQENRKNRRCEVKLIKP